MFALGLLFTIFCECHCCNLISNVYSNGFGVPVAGSQHVFNLLFNVFNLMITQVASLCAAFQIPTDSASRTPVSVPDARRAPAPTQAHH